MSEHLLRAAGGGQPLTEGEQGIAQLLGLAQTDQLLPLAGGEPSRRHADDKQHKQGEQVAVVGDAQGEVGCGEQQIVGDKAQHSRQRGGYQTGGEGRRQHPQHEDER